MSEWDIEKIPENIGKTVKNVPRAVWYIGGGFVVLALLYFRGGSSSPAPIQYGPPVDDYTGTAPGGSTSGGVSEEEFMLLRQDMGAFAGSLTDYINEKFEEFEAPAPVETVIIKEIWKDPEPAPVYTKQITTNQSQDEKEGAGQLTEHQRAVIESPGFKGMSAAGRESLLAKLGVK